MRYLARRCLGLALGLFLAGAPLQAQIARTAAAPLGLPELLTPTDGDVGIELEIELTWRAAPGATGYAVQVAPVDDFSVRIVDTTGILDTRLAVGPLEGGTTYFWRVGARGETVPSGFTPPFRFTTLVPIAAQDDGLPRRFDLGQNYPNPFNPSTVIPYALPEPAVVRMELFDLYGRRVRVLVDGPRGAGRHTVRLGADGLAGGPYVVHIRADAFTAHRTMLLVR